jgi:hypothetical protein
MLKTTFNGTKHVLNFEDKNAKDPKKKKKKKKLSNEK